MKKLMVGVALVTLVAVLPAQLDNVDITLDISKDPTVPDAIYWRGEQGGIDIPAHTSASVKVQTCDDLGIGGLDWFDGLAHSAQSAIAGHYVPEVTDSAVRRLTPTECERLQGFPDSWTHGKDGPRYAALGDAVTVNVAEWIGRRIMMADSL